jgi:anthranilate phosphoribosyltransferase
MLEQYTNLVQRGEILTTEQVRDVVGELTREGLAAETKAGFLMALARRGETFEEIAAFAEMLRGLSVQPSVPAELRTVEILDVVGTGGDRLNTFNISTGAALVAAAAGVRVAKHGNRAVTSKSGSADVLEALGIRIELEPDEVGPWLAEHGFAFLFAPKYHPAFRHIAPARKLCAAAGQRTLFNVLGPLLNPVRPSTQLMGVARPEWCEPMAHALRSLGVRRAMVVCGQVPASAGGPPEGASLDELSTLGPTQIAEYYQDRASNLAAFDPSILPLQPARLESLLGGDRETNARILKEILAGKDRGPRRDAVLLNAGAALLVAGSCRSIAEGWERAASVIDSGRALNYLDHLITASRGAK